MREGKPLKPPKPLRALSLCTTISLCVCVSVVSLSKILGLKERRMTTTYSPPPLGQTNPPIYYTPSMMIRPNGAAVFVAHADYFNRDKPAPMVTFVYNGETVVIMAFYHPIDAKHEFEWFLNDPEGWISVHHYPPIERDEESDEDSEGRVAEVGDDFQKRPAFIPLKPGRVLPGPWEVREVGPNV